MKKIKIAIVGMGVAGSYLINQLSSLGHKVTGFERYTAQQFECVCAWGTSRHGIDSFTKRCGLDFEDYVIHQGKKLVMEYGGNEVHLDLTGLVTFDKHRLVLDMQKDHRIIFGKWVRELEGKYDLIIDATGGIRALLPKIHDDLLIPAVQYRILFDKVPLEDFHLRMFETNSGYFWYFPLSNNEAHIGAGDYHRQHEAYINKFLGEFPGKKLKKVGRPIRLLPPSKCEPFFNGKVVGVGESIGTVFPLAGEGIIPSLQCADIFLKNIDDIQNYRYKVLEHYRIYDDAYDLLISLLVGKFTFPEDIFKLTTVMNELNNNSTRYGFSISPDNLIINNPFAILNAFSRGINIHL